MIRINLIIISCVISFPIVLLIPDPKLDITTSKRSEIFSKIEQLNSRLDELDLQLYAALETTDTANPELYQQVASDAANLRIEFGRLDEVKASFAGKVIGHTQCSSCSIGYTKAYQTYLDQVADYQEQLRLLDERRRNISQARGGLVHNTTIEGLWNERQAITSQLETEEIKFEAANDEVEIVRRTPLTTVKTIYQLVLLGLLILGFLAIFSAYMG